MMLGFSTAAIGMRHPPMCAPGTTSLLYPLACLPNLRGDVILDVNPGQLIKLYAGGDAVAFTCDKPIKYRWGGSQPTPLDVQFRPFVDKGIAYVKILNGRVGDTITASFWLELNRYIDCKLKVTYTFTILRCALYDEAAQPEVPPVNPP